MEVFCSQLLKEYETNIENVETQAMNQVASIEIPVFNTLSSLSRGEFQNYILKSAIEIRCQPVHVQSFVFTILTDVLTSTVKQKEFFDSYDKDCVHILHTLSKKIAHICNFVKKDEVDMILSCIDQMKKYSQRIEYPYLQHLLNTLQTQMIYKSNEIETPQTQTDIKKVMKNTTKSLNLDSNSNIKNEQKIEDTNPNKRSKMHINGTKTEETCNKENIPKMKVKSQAKNAFNVMMQASKAKKK